MNKRISKKKRVEKLLEELKALVREKVRMQELEPEIKEASPISQVVKETVSSPVEMSLPMSALGFEDKFPDGLKGMAMLDIKLLYLDNPDELNEEEKKWCRRRF